jgi:DNA-binding NarL/FixJ family response regulator
MGTLRILIADDHDLMRRGIRALLESHGWTICAEAQSGREAVEKAKKLKPDVAVLDIGMPELNGVEAARRIQKVSPNTEILILSVHYSDQIVREVVDAGIRGYVVKSDSDRDLAIAVEALAKHKPFFTPIATEAVLNNLGRGTAAAEAEPRDSRLTSREREILQLLSEGKSSKRWAPRWKLARRPPRLIARTLCVNWGFITWLIWCVMRYGTESLRRDPLS